MLELDPVTISEEYSVNYANGKAIRAGDIVSIDGKYEGKVIASMDTADYLQGEESWAYLQTGIMVMTNFAGLVHYTDEACDNLVLKKRDGHS